MKSSVLNGILQPLLTTDVKKIKGELKRFALIRTARVWSTLKVWINLLTYAILKTWVSLGRNTSRTREWMLNHENLYWARFPFDVTNETIYNPWLDAWTDPESVYWCRLIDFPSEWASLKQGDIIVDVGAHHGYWTISSSRLIGELGLVIAVEPHPSNYAKLLRNLAINGIQNCQPLLAACWSEKGTLSLVSERHSQWHHVVNTRGVNSTTSVVRGITIDDLTNVLGLTKVDLIKIDVEGSEGEVLRGSRRTLKIFHPKLLIEIHGTWEDILPLLESLGYMIAESQRDPLSPEWKRHVLAKPISTMER